VKKSIKTLLFRTFRKEPVVEVQVVEI